MGVPDVNGDVSVVRAESLLPLQLQVGPQDFDLAACLLYTSDAADDL